MSLSHEIDMEFQYRAIDGSRSQTPLLPVALSTHGLADGHDSDGPVQLVGNSVATLWRPDLPSPETAAVNADELRWQEEKARIRERILREEVEHWQLELEVRSEIRMQMLQLSWPMLGGPARGSGMAAAPSPGAIIAANSSQPVVTLEAHPQASALATAPTKRKSPDCAPRASIVSLAPSSKKQKSILTCTVCGVTTNSKKAMQDHLNGKVHKRKVVALPERPKLMPNETKQERGLKEGEEEAMTMETLGDYKPMKFMMATAAGALSEVMQMDRYLLCELCNVRTANRVTMMCHLQGSKHISNNQKKHHQPSSKPSDATIVSADPNKKLVLEDYSVPLPHTVRRFKGFLLWELCDVKAPLMNDMCQHLSGKKHKNKVNTCLSDASVNVSIDGKKTTKAQPIAKDDHTAVISDDMAATVEALAKKSLQPKVGDYNELQEMIVEPPKIMKSSATSAGAQLNNVCDSDSLTMEVDSVMHPLLRVEGFLICLSCNTKASSEIIMQSHLSGKKHKRKMALAAARGNNDLSVTVTRADEAQDNGSKSIASSVEADSAVPQANTAANDDAESAPSLAVPQAMASMTVDRPVEVQPATCITEPAEEGEIIEEDKEEHAAFDSNGSVTQAKESIITNYTTDPVKPIKIQVEGKVFTVMQQENSRLSCELCGIHGCDKDSMILHLYTRTHWGKANLAEKKEQQV